MVPKQPLFVVKDGAVEPYTETSRVRERLEDFILSERAGEAHDLCSKTIYNRSEKEIEGNNIEGLRK